MPQRLGDLVKFRGDRLFNGAVNINWFGTDASKTQAASEAFIFHGPQYHGVQQEDVGTGHGHKLMDTASFARAVVRRCYGQEEQPFTLAIAGYGTGKSHLGLTLATLLSDIGGKTALSVLSALEAADKSIGSEVRAILSESKQPCLVLALNGMQSFDLMAEITRQITRDLQNRGLETKPLDDIRPRFAQAASLVRMSNEEIVKEIITACDVASVEDVLKGLERQDEQTYAKIHDYFALLGMPIRALTGESVHDVINVTVREYCGKGKPYRSLVIIFDEFGKYTEFATVRSQIAGSGALQELFEAVQEHAGNVCFVGFIQFELNAYVQRIAPEYKNEILRYVTRYQTANRVYLSINLETLIASLLEKRKIKTLDNQFDNAEARKESKETIKKLAKWFPQIQNHRLWGDIDQFHSVVRKGCWPLSAYSTWFLFFLTAAGKHLQARSVLALLGDNFTNFEGEEVTGGRNWTLAPADLWSEALQQELLSSEESGQQGSITHAFASVNARHGARLTDDHQRILRSIVLALKMGLKVADRDDAIEALADLSGISQNRVSSAVRLLQEEYNVLEWDEAFKEFNILGDAVSRTQFLSFIRQRVAASYDETGKAKLFSSKAAEWCDLLGDIECDFAEENHITTREWRYQSVSSSFELLPIQVKLATDRWKKSIGVEDARGTIIYCYVEPSRDSTIIASEIGKLLRATARDANASTIPILIVLLCDEQGELGQALAEVSILEEPMSGEDQIHFGNLIASHKEKKLQVIRDQIEIMIKTRRYITCLKEELKPYRLDRVGTELFSKMYNLPIPFPFDGFSTAKGNAADTCQELTVGLLAGKLDYDGVIAKPVKAKNRAINVLKEAWGIFTKDGEVSTRPTFPTLRIITEIWDNALVTGDRRLPIAECLKQLCLPPYGANIASAGLILGVFVASRVENLIAVRKGQQIAISKLIQDDFFKNKFIDLTAIHDVILVSIGEASSEWETLLNEWEQAESHIERCSYYLRSKTLLNRVPIPPSLAYREAYLRNQAAASSDASIKMEKTQDAAIDKMEHGIDRGDVANIAKGASSLFDLMTKMSHEPPLWTEKQITELQPRLERAKQAIVMHFKEWLARQLPKSDMPDVVGDFKHHMIKEVGNDLKHIGLLELATEVENRTLEILRKTETVADARQILREVSSWICVHADDIKNVRVAQYRALYIKGKEFAVKLQEVSERISLAEIGTVRVQLSTFLKKIKEAEESAAKRGSAIWQTKLRSEEDVEHLFMEVEALVNIYENLSVDQEDFLLMRNALRMYQKYYQQLSSENLNWPDFEKLSEQLKREAGKMFSSDSTPWPPDDTIDGFVYIISKKRKDASTIWIDILEADAAKVDSLSTPDANQLHGRANNPPAILTEPHAKRLKKNIKDIESCLDTQKIEWLIEKFKELPLPLRKKFLQIVISGDKD